MPTATVSASVNQGFTGFSAVDVSVKDATDSSNTDSMGVSASVNVSMALNADSVPGSHQTPTASDFSELSSALAAANTSQHQSQSGQALQMAAAYTDAAAGSISVQDPHIPADMGSTAGVHMMHDVQNVQDMVGSIARGFGGGQSQSTEQPNVCKVSSKTKY